MTTYESESASLFCKRCGEMSDGQGDCPPCEADRPAPAVEVVVCTACVGTGAGEVRRKPCATCGGLGRIVRHVAGRAS